MMPKNKKPAGGRPAKNFDPSYARGKGGPKAGSRSAGHRGFKPESEAPAKKPRWNAEERASRPGSVGGDRRSSGSTGGRRDSTERGAYSDRPQRGARSEYGDRARDDRAPRRG